MVWLIDTERLSSCETVEALRGELSALMDSGVPIEAITARFDPSAWYRKRLAE